MTQTSAGAAAWTRQQTFLSRHATALIVLLGLIGLGAAIGQAWCVAVVVGDSAAAPLWLTFFGLLALIRAKLQIMVERASFRAGATARRRLRTDFLSQLLDLGPAALRRTHSGELASLVVDRVEALDGLFSRWLPAARLALFGPALVAACLALADPFAALVLAGAGLLVPLGMALAGIGAAAASQQQFQAMSRLQARFLDRVRGIATIVIAGQAEAQAHVLAVSADELRRRTMRVLRVAFLSSAALDAAFAAAIVVLALRYAAAWPNGASPGPSHAVFALLLVPEFFAPLRAFAAAYQDRFQARSAAQAVADLPSAPLRTAAAQVRTVAASGVTVAFKDVRLTLDASRGSILDGLSFRVSAGETLVLAGPSGAGKSTVLEMLLGFTRPDSGTVTINGADITTIVPQSLSRLTAWIGQRPVLFAGSIRDNIRFANPDAPDVEVEDAARSARVTAFVDALPLGLDTMIGEGGYGLSGGQAQRVAIARAFLKNAPLLLLDEPTAHLDARTEADVLDSLQRLALGRTVILATHSSAAHAFGSRRLDLRDGRIVAVRGAA